MKIHGLQKVTLLDFPGRVACTVFLGGCDYRCPFCHNYDLATGAAPAVMEDGELLDFLKKRASLLDGVAITGGEPCLRGDLPELIKKIRTLSLAVKLDTNGAHPDMLESLLAEHLVDYVAMDIKNSPEKYALTAGMDALDIAPIERSVQALMASDTDYEFRTTVVQELHGDRDIAAIGLWLKGAKRYFLQPFADRDSVPFEGFHAPQKETLLRWRELLQKTISQVEIRGLD